MRPSHGDIIQHFRDKDWAVDMNMMLLELERLAPAKKEIISAYIRGILDGIKSKKTNMVP